MNCLPENLIDYAYSFVYNHCKLTDNARKHFDEQRKRYASEKTSLSILEKIIKMYNPSVMITETQILPIDMKDPFLLRDVKSKAENNKYMTERDVLLDLSRVIRYIDDEGSYAYIQKVYNSKKKAYQIKWVSTNEMATNLKITKIGDSNLYSVLCKYQSLMTLNGVSFCSDEPDVFSVFQGFKYGSEEPIDERIIKPYLDLVFDVIASKDKTVYEYVLNWFANIVQHPSVKNETALVIKGNQGTGKGTFTNILCELLDVYAEKNITDISELTGQFNSVVESKMLIVLNEMKNVGDDRMANFNALKSIITDDTIRINEKNQPRRTAENVANFIFCTNNSYPLKVESGDRRYVVLEASGIHKNDFEYWDELNETFKHPKFYTTLMNYFLSRDLTKFNPRRIPMTRAKQILIYASQSPFEDWVNSHYDELISGMNCQDAIFERPMEMKEKAFQLEINRVCEHKRRRIGNGKLEYCYVLKDGVKEQYHQTKISQEEPDASEDES